MLGKGARRWLLAVGATAMAGLAGVSAAWGCASVAALDFTPAVAQPGQQVEVLVTFTHKDRPVELRWGSLDGPLLTTIDPSTFTEGLHGNWRFSKGTITVPADARPGNHIVIATQEFVRATALWGMPARGLLQVSAAGTPALGPQPGPAPVERPAVLVTEESVSASAMLVMGLAAAGVTMLIAGIGVIILSARRGRPMGTPAPVAGSER